MSNDITPFELRQKIRRGEHKGHTSAYGRGHVQCNLMILPEDWAQDFLRFCQYNPKPCPLIAIADKPGDPKLPSLGKDVDIRTDVSSYRIFEHGELVATVNELGDYWRDDLVTFAIGCSFSFEDALLADGLEVRNISEDKNVPMYRTNVPCRTAGRFSGNLVVSMRPLVAADAIRAVQICTRFPSVHGAPIHLGDPAQIGIANIDQPDFGDSVTIRVNELPVFWACGVTPQYVVENSKPPFCIAHGPGDMLVTDLLNSRLAIM